MKRLFYSLFVACALQACSPDSDLDPDNGNSTPSDYYELMAIPDKKAAFKAYPASTKQILGAGYDVTADYLSPEAIKAPVIDLDKMTDGNDDYITRMRVNASEPMNYAGRDAKTFLTDIAGSMKLDGISSKNNLSAGTILKHKEFQSDYDHSSQFSFASSEQVFTAERWNFWPFYISEKYKYKYLTQEFKNDVASLTAAEIIKKYGTHLLTDIGIGARFRGIYRTSVPGAASTSIERITLLSTLDAIARQGIFTGSGGSGWEEELTQSIGGQLVMEFFGGDTSLLSPNATTSDFNAWWSSFNEENYTLTKILNKVLPIYEMIEDTAKSEQVKNAMNDYIGNQQISMISTLPLLQAWDGKNHSYYTSYLESGSSYGRKYEGAVCSIYKQQRKNTVPLYLYSNGQKQRLSLEQLQKDAGWKLEREMGYVYTSSVEGAIPLYEAESKSDYCYTTEDKQEYGEKGNWKKAGIACYVMPL